MNGHRSIFLALALLVLASCGNLDRSLSFRVSTEEPAPSVVASMAPLLEARGFSITIDSDDDTANIIATVRDARSDLAIIEEPLSMTPGVVALTPLYPSILHVLYKGTMPGKCRGGRSLLALFQFLKEPAFYLPQYQAWCAITLALGQLICPDYSNFKVEDNRLLFFEVTGFTNGRLVWNSDPVYYRDQADINFERLKESQ